MERMFKKILSLSLLLSAVGAQAECNTGSCSTGSGSTTSSSTIHSVTPTIVVRSPGANAVRRMIQSVGHLNKAEMVIVYGTMAMTIVNTGSLKRIDFVNCFFGA